MDITVIAILLAVLLAIVGVAGDFFVKIAGSGPTYVDYKWLIIGALIYAATAFGWFYVMKHVKLSTLGVVYAVSTVLFLTILSVVYFKEQVNTYEILGIIAGVVSIVLLARFA